jgi:hypothetical protein
MHSGTAGRKAQRDDGVRLKVSVRRGVSPHFFRGEGMELAEKGAGLTPAPSVPDTFNRTRDDAPRVCVAGALILGALAHV